MQPFDMPSGSRPKPGNPHKDADAIKGTHPENDPSVARQYGPWQIESSRVVYQDPWVSLRRDEVIRPDGLQGSYSVSSVKPGVCVVAIDDSGVVHLTEEFHYAVGRITIEGVSGGIEADHSASQMAHRELEEELGIIATDLLSLGIIDPFTASVVSPTELFLARGLTFGVAKPEATELITHIKMPLDSAINAVMHGEITHAPTCIILLKLGLLREKLGL
jgi:ADP-ribose pyrophosphatase